MLLMILVGITAALISAVVTTLFFFFRYGRRFTRWLNNDQRSVALELEYARQERIESCANEKECGTNDEAKE